MTVEKEKRRIIIQRIQDLPTLPSTLAKIIKVAESPSSTAVELGDVISKDQSISSMILKIVNSAFYGHLRQISSISHAIVILGFQMVKTLALGVSIFQASPNGARPAFDRGRFWLHSIGVATCAKSLSGKIDLGPEMDRETIFLSGLLHDIGKVVFDTFFNEEYRLVARAAVEEELLIRDVEARELGMDHAEAGYHLARKWQFPTPVINAIRFHHDLAANEEGDGKIESLVHVSDRIVRMLNIGYGGDKQEPPVEPLALEKLGLSEGDLEALISMVEERREEIEAFTLEKV